MIKPFAFQSWDKEQVNTFKDCILELLPSTNSLHDLEAIEKWKEQMVTRQENMFADLCIGYKGLSAESLAVFE
ncbi:hypothetical protein K443DRAFT_11221 [Laccaria amethystina LaAM-08-1]|uniref:Uncharacterized protein n=1 Tax=Laccaria amethystina LaAM-08-1 TaxID=1095629 RepID=A0A0C9WU48_9AGAR|nr:hypothetical protein K443DRAFT_11221 [Laccaria amethystina LaAM-08-1]